MTIEIEIPQTVIEKVVTGIMENFPEASTGCALQCIGWHYKTMQFLFQDEDGKRYAIGWKELREAFPLLFTDQWPKGCTRPPASGNPEDWEQWLGEADATDFDAFAQLACLKEVIYG